QNRRSGGDEEQLLVNRREVMIRIGIELPLEGSLRLYLGRLIGGIGIGLVALEAIDAVVLGIESAQHVVERAVLHHQDDDVFQVIQSSRHWLPLWPPAGLNISMARRR